MVIKIYGSMLGIKIINALIIFTYITKQDLFECESRIKCILYTYIQFINIPMFCPRPRVKTRRESRQNLHAGIIQINIFFYSDYWPCPCTSKPRILTSAGVLDYCSPKKQNISGPLNVWAMRTIRLLLF